MAEQHLVAKAAEFAPPALRALGERILEVVCPERYDDQERKALLAAERRASAATRLSLHVRRGWVRRPARSDSRSHRSPVADVPGGVHRTPAGGDLITD